MDTEDSLSPSKVGDVEEEEEEETVKLVLDPDEDDEDEQAVNNEDEASDDELCVNKRKKVGLDRLVLSDSDDDSSSNDPEKSTPSPQKSETGKSPSKEDETTSNILNKVSDDDEVHLDESTHKSVSSSDMSEKDRASNMFSIRSNSQRRLRESTVELPVHVPKKLSLNDFLNRKKGGEADLEAIYNEEHQNEEEENPKNRRRSLLLQKLGLNLSQVQSSQPKLSAKNDTINLGSIDTPTTRIVPKGLTDLQGRLAKHMSSSAPSSLKKDRTISVVSKEVRENGTEVLKEASVSIPDEGVPSSRLSFEVVEKAKKSEVSGAQFRALKETLRVKMMENRKKDLVKKELLKKMEEEEVGFQADDIDDDFEDEEDVPESSEGETESEPEEEPELVDKKILPKNRFIEDEAEEDEDEDFDKDEDTGPLTLEEDTCTETNNDLAGHGSPPLMIPINQEATSSKNTTPFSQLAYNSSIRWTPIEDRDKEKSTSLTQQHARKRLGFEELFDATDPCVDDFSDVVGLCSGQFLFSKEGRTLSKTQINILGQTQKEKSETQDTIPLVNGSLAKEEDVVEDDDDFEGFKNRKPTQRIVVSDDSSNEEEEAVEQESESILQESAPPRNVEDVEYDSEENEVPVKQSLFNQKGFLRDDFYEKEAELSGSEVGSEDEDEGDLDELDMEEGDLDDIDQDKVREEVGKIHHNQLLDEDKRDVRLFQEAFLEDGDLHSDKSRGRSFRWLNNEETEELEKRPSDDEEEVEDEKMEKLRLERLEREKWLKDSASLLDESDDENVDSTRDDSQLINLGNKALRRLEKAYKTNQVSSVPKKQPAASSKLPLQSVKNTKGSFLSRASEKLTKLAELSKNKGETREGTGAKGNSRNFVFCALSPQKKNDKSEGSNRRRGKKKESMEPPGSDAPVRKKARVERTLQDGNTNTIFGFL